MSKRLLILTTALALGACGEPAPSPASPAPAKPRTAKADEKADEKVAAKEEAAAEAAPVYKYEYSPIGKRDPFRSVLDEMTEKEQQDQNPTCGPLCKWDLDQLKLVAVISGVSNPLAMVEDPAGKGHVVRHGTAIGRRNGQVTQIRTGEIIVTEVRRDQMGKIIKYDVHLKLPVDAKREQDEQNLLGAEVSE